MDKDAFPPASWTVDTVRDALSETDGGMGLPRYEDARRWEDAATVGPSAAYAQRVIDAAETHHGDPVTRLPATLYADYERTGNRRRYERAYFDRHRRLALSTLAMCLERDERFLDDVLDHAWAISEQSTWLLPAHLPADERIDGLPTVRDPADHEVALFSARTAHLLAEVDYLLGDRLPDSLRERIRVEIDERVLTPFQRREDFHWLREPTGNWSAVCTASTLLAGLYVESDLDRLADLIVEGLDGVGGYLRTFGRDGCATEGLSYWNFGFSHYAMVADALRARTEGRLSLFTPPILDEIARFPLRIRLSPGRHVPFSDARETDDVDPYLACWAGSEFDADGLVDAGVAALDDADRPFFQRSSDSLMEAVRNLFWPRRDTESATTYRAVPRTFFTDAEWWIGRAAPADPNGLVVAAKGGHNGEPHNHNDCGSFVVHYRGESSLTDLGTATYDRGYFGEDRYEYLTTRSLGHSVPLINGCEQVSGSEHTATVLEQQSTGDTERFTLELADCYPVSADLSSLERSFVLDRAESVLTVTDSASFEDSVADPVFEGVFVSYCPMEPDGNGLTVEGEHTRTRVSVGSQPVSVSVERLPDAVDRSGAVDDTAASKDVWRAKVVPRIEPEQTAVEMTTRIDPGSDG